MQQCRAGKGGGVWHKDDEADMTSDEFPLALLSLDLDEHGAPIGRALMTVQRGDFCALVRPHLHLPVLMCRHNAAELQEEKVSSNADIFIADSEFLSTFFSFFFFFFFFWPHSRNGRPCLLIVAVVEDPSPHSTRHHICCVWV